MKTVVAVMLFAFPGLALARSKRNPGVLLLAHGGVADWDKDVLNVAKDAGRAYPVEVAFGMADGEQLQKAVDALEKRGVNDIVAVPLFVSSKSEVLDHTRFLLHLRDEPSKVFVNAMRVMAAMPHHMMPPGHSMKISTTPVRLGVETRIRMTPALDAHPLVVGIIAEHAKALSQASAADTLIIVGHGPYDDKSNEAWLSTLGRIAGRVQEKEGFKAAYGVTLRDDNPPSVKHAAIRTLRDKVSAASNAGGRAIVVPDLIAREGIESHITDSLSGLDFAWDGRTLLPHPNIAKWVVESARGAFSVQ